MYIAHADDLNKSSMKQWYRAAWGHRIPSKRAYEAVAGLQFPALFFHKVSTTRPTLIFFLGRIEK